MNEIDIKKYLTQYSASNIIFVPNKGNLGDDVINYSCLEVLQELNINYTIGSFDKEYKNKILFYGGGGNYINKYTQCETFIKNNVGKNKIVILPHTIHNVEDSVKSLDKDVDIFCREPTSYNWVLNTVKHPENVFIYKDMSFLLDLTQYKDRPIHGFHLECFRKDLEMTVVPCQHINIDAPLQLKDEYDSPKHKQVATYDKIKYNCNILVNFISMFDTIRTNRLHVAIVGSMLDKKVTMFPNSYYKNKSVYDYSMKDNYKNLSFDIIK